MAYGRSSPELGGPGEWDHKQVDAHRFLAGRERAPADNAEDILGRRPGDAQQLFPKFTSASVTTTGQVEVNGKMLNLWTYQQLETLAAPVLRQRAAALRDAIGEANCVPQPSGQKTDMIRWIIEVQAQLTQESPQAGRRGTAGVANAVPQSFFQEAQAARDLARDAAPFGPGRGQGHDGTRDHYNDLIYKRNEFHQAGVAGIVSNRAGGEGRRHLQPEMHMDGFGVSSKENDSPSRRRYLGCDDHLMQQKRDAEAGVQAAVEQHHGLATRATQSSCTAHPSDSQLEHHGVPSSSAEESQIGGERRRHAAVTDRMVHCGLADPGEQESRLGGRRHLDSFGGSRYSESQASSGYQSSWKKDPSRLRGTSMLC